MLTVNEQVAVLPDVFVAVQVTVVVPTGNVEPDGGVHDVTTPGQLSETVGLAKVVTAPLAAGHVMAVTAVTLAGHVIVGGCKSKTPMVNVQLGPAVVVQVTVVVPTGKNEPNGGLHITGEHEPVSVGCV